MSENKKKQLNWLEIFEFGSNDITIVNAINIFYWQYAIIVKSLETDLSNFYQEKQKYVFPDSNLDLAKQMKILTVYGFWLIYNITNEPKLQLTISSFLDNKKTVTPDVFFYVLTLLNEIILKTDDKHWLFEFINLITIVESISKKYSDVLQVNFDTLSNMDITIDDYKNLMKNKNND